MFEHYMVLTRRVVSPDVSSAQLVKKDLQALPPASALKLPPHPAATKGALCHLSTCARPRPQATIDNGLLPVCNRAFPILRHTVRTQ